MKSGRWDLVSEVLRRRDRPTCWDPLDESIDPWGVIDLWGRCVKARKRRGLVQTHFAVKAALAFASGSMELPEVLSAMG
jgi:hypothetical protein